MSEAGSTVLPARVYLKVSGATLPRARAFKLAPTTDLGSLNRVLGPGTLLYDGQAISPNDTPEALGMPFGSSNPQRLVFVAATEEGSVSDRGSEGSRPAWAEPPVRRPTDASPDARPREEEVETEKGEDSVADRPPPPNRRPLPREPPRQTLEPAKDPELTQSPSLPSNPPRPQTPFQSAQSKSMVSQKTPPNQTPVQKITQQSSSTPHAAASLVPDTTLQGPGRVSRRQTSESHVLGHVPMRPMQQTPLRVPIQQPPDVLRNGFALGRPDAIAPTYPNWPHRTPPRDIHATTVFEGQVVSAIPQMVAISPHRQFYDLPDPRFYSGSAVPHPTSQQPAMWESVRSLERQVSTLQSELALTREELANERSHGAMRDVQIRRLGSMLTAQFEDQRVALIEDTVAKEHERFMRKLRQERHETAN